MIAQTIAIQPEAAWMSIRKDSGYAPLNPQTFVYNNRFHLSGASQRQTVFSLQHFLPRERPPLHFTSTPPSGYLRLFTRKNDLPFSLLPLPHRRWLCRGASTACCDGGGRDGGGRKILLADIPFTPPMEASEGGQQVGGREIGWLVFSFFFFFRPSHQDWGSKREITFP